MYVSPCIQSLVVVSCLVWIAGCWVLGAGFWILDAGAGSGCWIAIVYRTVPCRCSNSRFSSGHLLCDHRPLQVHRGLSCARPWPTSSYSQTAMSEMRNFPTQSGGSHLWMLTCLRNEARRFSFLVFRGLRWLAPIPCVSRCLGSPHARPILILPSFDPGRLIFFANPHQPRPVLRVGMCSSAH